jgi:hypothetical protein
MSKINFDGEYQTFYEGAQLTIVRKVIYDEFPPRSPQVSEEENIWGSTNIDIEGEDLNRLKRFILSCKSNLRINLVLITDEAGWKKLFKGHANANLLLSATFEDMSAYWEIDEGKPLETADGQKTPG